VNRLFYYSANGISIIPVKTLAKLLLPDNRTVIVAHDWLELGMITNLGLQNP
jgi:hypothetical protein